MQNRFTAKDFFYMLIGLVVCVLLFLNMTKTDREAVVLDRINETLTKQQAALRDLTDKVAQGPRVVAQGPTGSGGSAAASDGARAAESAAPETTPADPATAPRGSGPENAAKKPNYTPGYNVQFSAMAKEVNRRGLPQKWQTAPDAELGADFAPGDAIILTWTSDAQTLTPYVATDNFSRRVFWEVMEYLVNADIDAPFDYVPGLARSWEVSPDGMELTFHLFPNATWSDGRPVTSEDIIFSWDLATNEKIEAATYRSYISENVAKWEALDPLTVRFVMKQPYFDAVGICGNLLSIIPKHVYGQYDEETYNKKISDVCVGSGPWVLESWERNTQITLKRNENYWGPKPPLARQIIRIISNQTAELQEFKAGSIDLMAPQPEVWNENINQDWFTKRDAKAIKYYTPQAGYQYIGYNMRKPFFADKRVRQALTMLIDRQAIIDTLRFGMGQTITGPFYIKGDQYNKDLKPWPFDPVRARAQLKECGWEDTDGDGVIDRDIDGDGRRDPFEVTFLVPASGIAFYGNLQNFIQKSFQEGGIKVNLDKLEWAVFLDRLNEGNFDMTSLIWTQSPESDPYQIFHTNSIANKGSNRVGYSSPEADRIMEEARRTIDYDTRMQLWRKFGEILHEDQPYTFLFTSPTRAFLHERFRGVQMHDYRLYQSAWYVASGDQIR